MVTIEYNNITIEVPTSWQDIKVRDYETFYMDKPETTSERIELIAKICKTEASILRSWPAEIFNTIVDKCDFIFKETNAEPCPSIVVNGKTYIVPIEEKLSLGAYVDADEVQKSGEAVISNVLAIVCRPAGEEYDHENNEERAVMFADLPVSQVLGVLAFFLLCKTMLIKHTSAYKNLAQVVESLPPSIRVFRSPGGGIRLSQIWRATKYYVLMKLLNYRLRKYLRLFNTNEIKPMQKRHKES